MGSYKHSLYNIDMKVHENTYIIFNTKTQGLLEVNEDIFQAYKQVMTNSEKVLNKFLEYGFWINNSIDEIEDLTVMHRKKKYSNNSMNVTIKTTNNCNFLCRYCYQEHSPSNLDQKTTINIIDFFQDQIDNKGVKYVYIHWFGGEPLLNVEPIN